MEFSRKLTTTEIKTLADLLLGTDDDLAIGISQLGYDPDTVVKPPLLRIGRVFQCRECGFWRKGRRGQCCTSSNKPPPVLPRPQVVGTGEFDTDGYKLHKRL